MSASPLGTCFNYYNIPDYFYDLGAFIIPALDKLKEDVESGKIDPVKGTDLDKIAIEQVIELLKKQLA
jgi:hypothetical protein